MKYCKFCGTQLNDDAAFCSNCGRACEPLPAQQTQTATPAQQVPVQAPARTEPSGIKIAAKIFMILGCVASAFLFLIPLCWTIPMTVHYCNALRTGQRVSAGFKVCVLLFLNTIAGILLFLEEED